MRRFSQRSALVTLSEINITPLLDLAFVLLIIFVITTPLLEKGLNLSLPQGGREDSKLEKRDLRVVEIDPKNGYFLNHVKLSLNEIEENLKRDFRLNPNLVVWIRADENTTAKALYAIIDRCQRNGIKRYSLRTEPAKPANR